MRHVKNVQGHASSFLLSSSRWYNFASSRLAMRYRESSLGPWIGETRIARIRTETMPRNTTSTAETTTQRRKQAHRGSLIGALGGLSIATNRETRGGSFRPRGIASDISSILPPPTRRTKLRMPIGRPSQQRKRALRSLKSAGRFIVDSAGPSRPGPLI